MTLDAAIAIWDSEEHSVEEKLSSLEKHVFVKLGLEHEADYYTKNGKLLERFVAGFIDRYFTLLKDASFVFLDPLHIVDITTSFAKSVFLHPIATLKKIWGFWSGYYTTGAYGVGMIVADALLASFLAGASLALSEGEVVAATEEAIGSLGKNLVSNVTSLPNAAKNVAKSVVGFSSELGELFASAISNPKNLINQAKTAVLSKTTNYFELRKFKFYASKFIKHRYKHA